MQRLSDAQKTTIMAIADTMSGPLPRDVASDVVAEHMDTLTSFSHGLDSTQDTKALMRMTQVQLRDLSLLGSMEVFLRKMPTDKWTDMEKVLTMLSTGGGTKTLTGAARAVPFHDLPSDEREAALQSLMRSPVAKSRAIFQTFKSLVLLCVYAKTRASDGLMNPIWAPLEYPGKPLEQKRPPLSAFWEPSFEEYVRHPMTFPLLKALSANAATIELETDVVVVGSGAGGGVLAAELAQAGHRVLVLEKASYSHPADRSFAELQSYWENFECGMFMPSEDGSMYIRAGSAWGGSTCTNWAAAPSPPPLVLEEWAMTHNLPFFQSTVFQEAIQIVCRRVGVSDIAVKHNAQNQVLIDGATKLGYPVETVPQNTNGHVHACGYCTLGCPYGEKQGSHMTWLKDAADAGAKFIDGCHVDRVTYDDTKRVTGVVGMVLHGKVPLIVKAKTVVSACGGIHTPALLLRSGLKNPNIGRHLRLHPTVSIHGFLPHREVKGWSGSILTSVCNVVRNIHSNGYGARVQVPASLIGLVASYLPWRSNADFRRLMMQLPRTANMMITARDLDSTSRVTVDAEEGRPRVHVALGVNDRESLVEGLIAAAKVLLSQGAVEINTGHFTLPPLQLKTAEDLANPIECHTTQTWFAALRQLGAVQNSIGLFSGDHMGSCRMSTSPEAGAVNPDGESWEVRGLYVADASLFPTASGVNPMVTTFAVAYSVAQFLKANLSDHSNAGKKVFPVTSNWTWYLLLSSRTSVLALVAALVVAWLRQRILALVRTHVFGIKQSHRLE
ncbi:Aste57867_10991 [Aphanomyces stellatus]|uniref:Long-chain-alcohol oxidase n=1 Tax=Aphanomyces stellatus TaxID=120398 RepID=A0A485KRT1_9STRA|nr:hypothetical protein As57867_010950 [Aphanomyces stellatus]VFT87859.1 Aste57867_10991 [Aphanomyces stellatus]